VWFETILYLHLETIRDFRERTGTSKFLRE